MLKVNKSTAHRWPWVRIGIIILSFVILMIWLVFVLYSVYHGSDVLCGENATVNLATYMTLGTTIIGVIVYYFSGDIRGKARSLIRRIPMGWDWLMDSGYTLYFDPEYYTISHGRYVRITNNQIKSDELGLPIVDSNIPLNSFNMNIYRRYHQSILDSIKSWQIVRGYPYRELLRKTVIDRCRIVLVGKNCLVVKARSGEHLLVHKSKYIEFMEDQFSTRKWSPWDESSMKKLKEWSDRLRGINYFVARLNGGSTEPESNDLITNLYYDQLIREMASLKSCLSQMANPQWMSEQMSEVSGSVLSDPNNRYSFPTVKQEYIKYRLEELVRDRVQGTLIQNILNIPQIDTAQVLNNILNNLVTDAEYTKIMTDAKIDTDYSIKANQPSSQAINNNLTRIATNLNTTTGASYLCSYAVPIKILPNHAPKALVPQIDSYMISYNKLHGTGGISTRISNWMQKRQELRNQKTQEMLTQSANIIEPQVVPEENDPDIIPYVLPPAVASQIKQHKFPTSGPTPQAIALGLAGNPALYETKQKNIELLGKVSEHIQIELDKISAENIELQSKKAELDAKKTAIDAIRTTLPTDAYLNNLKTENTGLRGEIEQYASILAANNQTIQQLDATATALSAAATQRHNDLLKLQSDTHTKVAQLDEAEQKIQYLNEQLAQSSARMAERDALIVGLNARFGEQMAKQNSLINQVAEIKQKRDKTITDLEQQIIARDAQYKAQIDQQINLAKIASEAQKAELEKQIAIDQQSKLADRAILEQQLETFKQAKSDEQTKVEAQLMELTQAKDAIAMEATNLKNESHQLIAQIQENNAKLTEANRARQIATAMLDAQAIEIHKFHNKTLENTKKIADMNIQLDSKVHELEASKSKYADQLKLSGILKLRLTSQEIGSAKRLSKTKEELEQQKAELDNLKHVVEGARANEQLLQQKIDQDNKTAQIVLNTILALKETEAKNAQRREHIVNSARGKFMRLLQNSQNKAKDDAIALLGIPQKEVLAMYESQRHKLDDARLAIKMLEDQITLDQRKIDLLNLRTEQAKTLNIPPPELNALIAKNNSEVASLNERIAQKNLRINGYRSSAKSIEQAMVYTKKQVDGYEQKFNVKLTEDISALSEEKNTLAKQLAAAQAKVLEHEAEKKKIEHAKRKTEKALQAAQATWDAQVAQFEAEKQALATQLSASQTQLSAQYAVLKETCTDLSKELEQYNKLITIDTKIPSQNNKKVQINVSSELLADLNKLLNVYKEDKTKYIEDTHSTLYKEMAKVFPSGSSPEGADYLQEINGKLLNFVYLLYTELENKESFNKIRRTLNSCSSMAKDIKNRALVDNTIAFLNNAAKIFDPNTNNLQKIIHTQMIKINISPMSTTVAQDILSNLNKYGATAAHMRYMTTNESYVLERGDNAPDVKKSTHLSVPVAAKTKNRRVELDPFNAINTFTEDFQLAILRDDPDRRNNIINKLTNFTSLDPEVYQKLSEVTDALKNSDKDKINTLEPQLIDSINKRIIRKSGNPPIPIAIIPEAKEAW